MKKTASNKSGYNVILVCSDRLLRQKIIHDINLSGKYNLLSCAENGFALLHQFGKYGDQADIVISDLFLEGINGIEALQVIRQHSANIQFMVYSALFQKDLYPIMKKIDVSMYCPKNELSICNGLESLSRNSGTTDIQLFDWEEYMYLEPLYKKNSQTNLSGLEIKIIEAISNGSSNKEIATDQHLSLRTIESNISQLLKKLSLRHRVDIVRFAYENGVCATSCSIFRSGKCETDSLFRRKND
ncbi:response regulator transcription factor [Chitinophaga flava]|uniref:HTH luxR-type domain-containing protein n=1 Tax=Chitinophaga flava TaxID=2259036 RepID=A0A365XWH5_9BACT|nr:response regulator transcription factor [Chitinophaga flava]RBL90054.1 hypothetical protein DF182_26650 [Chitinophaga flava]